MNKLALITGATSGIGMATAKLLAFNHFNLIITGRRNERLIEQKQALEKEYNIKVLALNFDIRNRKEVVNAIENLKGEWREIDVLVNNAGLASGLNQLQDGDIEDWDKMIDTNIKGLLYISKEVAPIMIQRQKGHIVNISSIAGREVYDKGNVYCATKHAVEALTKGMRIDLVKHNIKVTAIAPGMVETEFSIVRFHGNTEAAKKVYEGFDPLLAEDIADAILYVVTRPPHVCINDMLIMPTNQASATIVNRNN
jgi:3-hydroxy acid dehydrogenase/malonic semialdehyde reductase